MGLQVVSVDERPLIDAVNVLNRGFSDYIVKIQFDTRILLRTIRYDQIDCSNSWIVEEDGEDVGICLVARRGWSTRLAAMAIIPDARGKGVGSWLVEQLIRQAIARGDREMELEVIEGNDAAIGLYEAHGFNKVRRLLSFQTSGPNVKAEIDIHEVDIRELARHVTRFGLANLPWQISGESLAQMNPPNRGYQLDDSFLILSDPEEATIAIRGMITLPQSRRRGMGKRILQAAMTKHADRKWVVPALCPQEFEAFFLSAGFEADSLAQYQMSRRLI